jgi:hypothetical protein
MRRSTRLEKRPPLETKNLGKVGTKYISDTYKHCTSAEINRFVEEEIQEGPQIVTLPVPPYRHAIYVDVQTNIIMISHWRESHELNNEQWKTYKKFLDKLQKKYKKQIQFYNVDPELYKKASEKNRASSGGGCSQYLYDWIQKIDK